MPDSYQSFKNELESNDSNTNTNLPKKEGNVYDKLKEAIPEFVFRQISFTAGKFNITTNLRLVHFLSQCAHESAGFKAVVENLNYSSEALVRVFPKYFPDINLANTYARQPLKIASRVYASRMGNGNEASGDGYKFRGRGYIQLTGKNNYAAFTKFINVDCVVNPDLIATTYPLASAAFYFDSNGLWSVCDKGNDEATVKEVTKRVNGGTIGLDDRLEQFKKFSSLLA